MKHHAAAIFLAGALCAGSAATAAPGPAAADDPAGATLRILAGKRSPHRIPALITGKFAEHLGSNILNGMDAQILRNPTFASYSFWSGRMTPDGVTSFHHERERIDAEIRRLAGRHGWPAAEIDRLIEDYHGGLACWWARAGSRDAVKASPDTGPHGGRAQRVEVGAAGGGIFQWTYLPLHRARKYEFEAAIRSPDIPSFSITLAPAGAGESGAAAFVTGIGSEWRAVKGTLEVADGLPADAAYRFSLTAESAGGFVVGRILLRPADHIGGADPDVVRLLRESRLPILRWPGGNFASGYRWEDGVGPAERRPTHPNLAWGGVEPNLFGTGEFVAFCRAAGCEPMICINAGDGTPEEAARWVEYSNGSAETPMGRRRAAHGHPEPFGIRRWEVGNELWGRWQVHWTTAAGYADRYRRFAAAMRAADPGIELYACGAPVLWRKDWNDELIRGTAAILGAITDHPLIGGGVPADADPLDVFRDFMAVPDVLEERWAALRGDMAAAGVRQPRLAVTELQMFARLAPPADPGAPERLSRENLVGPATLAEALYDVLIYHAAVRLAPFVEMVTHSATVNHGGGLRKERERVYSNPCHHAQAAFAEFAGAAPVALELESPSESAPRVLPDLRNAVRERTYRSVDALAAVDAGGDLLISIVHRGSRGPIRLRVEAQGFEAGARAQVRALSGGVPWAANTLESPQAVQPADSLVEVRDGAFPLDLAPFSVLRVRIPRARPGG